MAAPGTTAEITYTQMGADCRRRVTDGDSTYLPLSKYYTTPGQIQTITLPFAEFTQNVKGSRFDMVHLKDFTIVNVKPLRQPIYFRNMRLLGGCAGSNASRTISSTTMTATSTMAATVSFSVEPVSPLETIGSVTPSRPDQSSRAIPSMTTLAGSLLAATLAVFAFFV
jgi:hypothetical protein